MDMVVTSIQPPKSMQKTENSQVTRSIPIPAASASHRIVSSYSDSQKNSAFVSSRLEKDSPQRSAGSFNVHPIRKPIMSSELKDHHSTAASEVDYDESDVVMCWSNPAAGVGAPSCTLSLINANSWEDQSVANPKLSSDYLHRCEIEEPKTLNVGVNVASITSDMIRISSADSMSTARSRSVVSHAGHDSPIKSVSFSQKFVKEDELRHAPGEHVSDYPPSSHVLCKEEALIYKEKLISMEEDDTFAYSLQEEFWAQNGTLCESDAILQDDQMVDTLFIDIPASGSSNNESAKSTYAGIHAAHAKHPVSTMSTFDRINMGSSYSITSSDSLQYSVYGILGSSPSLGEIDFCETFLVAGVDESSHPEEKSHQISLMQPRGEENHHVNNVVRDPYNWMNSKGQHIMSRHEDESMIIRGSHLLVSSSNSMHNISLNIPQDSNSSYRVAKPNGEINTGRSPLSRSCSLSNIQPICHEREHCPPLTGTCSLGTVGLARCKKRSFSAANLQLSESLSWPNPALMHASVGTNAASKQEIKSQSGQDQAMQQRATKKQLNQHQIQQKQQRVQLPYDGNHINDGVKKQTRPQLAQKLRRRHGTATDPQSVAARTRREKFSDRIRMLQSLVPKGERLDTVSMLGQTLEYIRFLQHQVWELYHGPGTSSPLMYSSAKSEKWKDFIEAPSTTTTTNAPAAPNCT